MPSPQISDKWRTKLMAFRKPGTKRIGAKVLAYGDFGSGKTLFALSWPKIAAIDSENGMTDYESTEDGKNLIGVENSQSFNELEDNIDYVYDNFKEVGIQTLVIDSETKIYQNIEQAIMTIEEKRARKKGREVDDTNLSVRSYGRIRYVGTKLQNLKIDLTSNGVHVVSVAQAKPIKKKVGEDYVTTGYTPIMSKGAEYDYDIVVFCYREEDLVNGGYKYFSRIEKDRTRTFNPGQVIEGGVTYDQWKNHYEKNLDKEVLGSKFAEQQDSDIIKYEKESSDESKSLKTEIMELYKSLTGNDLELFKKELKASKVTDFESMTVNQQKAIEKLINKYK